MNTTEQLAKKYGLHLEYIEIMGAGRNDLAKWLYGLDFKVGVEVGVASGEYSRVLLDTNPQMELYGVDPWVPYPGYHDYQKESTFEKMYQETLKVTEGFDNYHIIKKFSVDAVKDFKDGSVDFIYLDGNHSGEAVKEDIETWMPKMKKGGIMSGHDFTGRWPSLQDSVKKYTNKHRHKLVILGLENKYLDPERDTSRSWMYVC